MKRAFLAFAMAVMLTASLAACTTTSSDAGANKDTGSSMQDNANSHARSNNDWNNGNTMTRNGRYHADDNGNVFDWNNDIGSDIRTATDDMMDGVDNAINDMTH